MRKSWPILLLTALLLGIVCVSGYTYPSSNSKDQSARDSSPISNIPQDHGPDSANKEQAPEHTPFWAELFLWPTGIQTLGILMTLIFIGWQALLTRESIGSADKSTRVELRAYLSLIVSGACYQDRDKGRKFEGLPVLVNTGKTPARKVRYKRQAAILKDPLPASFSLSIPQEDIGEYDLGPEHRSTIPVLLEDFIPQEDVEAVMSATQDRALYCWGTIFYEDCFGDSHRTDFCHRMWFTPNTDEPGLFKVNGNYVAGRNKAT